jgi:hypothetical protein
MQSELEMLALAMLDVKNQMADRCNLVHPRYDMSQHKERGMQFFADNKEKMIVRKRKIPGLSVQDSWRNHSKGSM